MEKSLTAIAVFSILTVMFFAYMKHTQYTMDVNGKKYAYAGMIEMNDNGQKIYTAIYREIH